MEEQTTGEQGKNKGWDNIKPYQYKKGQSGNPSGRPKGISLKEYAKMKFNTMTDDEKEDFLNGLDKDKIWEMGEGKPETRTDVTSNGETINQVLVKFIDGKGNDN